MRNRFKGLDLIGRVPDELYIEVHDIVQEKGIKNIPKKKKCKKAKWLSEEALQIAVKRRKVKSKGEMERYTHLNAEFQRIARRDKKAFLHDQCKETEENNRMGKTRDLKKIRDTKGIFHTKMGSTWTDMVGPNRSSYLKGLPDSHFAFLHFLGNISCKDGLEKGQKWYGPNRSRRY